MAGFISGRPDCASHIAGTCAPSGASMKAGQLERRVGALWALLIVFGWSVSGALVPIAGDPVVTGGGPVAGTQLSSGVRAYLGIRYAAPPTQDLRWKSPQPSKWSGTWVADRKGPECVQ